MFKNKSTKKRPEISGPLSFEHRVHTGYDTQRGQFVGLPKQWASVVEPMSTSRPKPIVDPSMITHTEAEKQKTVVRGHSGSHLNGDVHGITVARSNSLRQHSPSLYHRNNFMPSEPPVPEHDRGAPGRPPPGYAPPGEYPPHGQQPPPYHDYSSLPRSNSRREDMRDPRDSWNNQRNMQDDPRYMNGPPPVRDPRDPQIINDPRDMNRPPQRDTRNVRDMNSLPRGMNRPGYRDHPNPYDTRDPRDINGPLDQDVRDGRIQDPRDRNMPSGPGGDMRDPRDLNGTPQQVRDPRDPRNANYRNPPSSADYIGAPRDKRDYRNYRDSREFGRQQSMPEDNTWPKQGNGTLPRDGGTLPRDNSTLTRDNGTLPRDNRGQEMDPHNNNLPYSKSNTLPPRSPTGGHYAPYQQQQQQQPNGSNMQPNPYSSLPRHTDSNRSRTRPEVAPKPQVPPVQQPQQHAQQYDRGMEPSPRIPSTPSSPNHHPPSPRSPKPAEKPSSIGPYPSSPGAKSQPYPEQQRLSHEQVVAKHALDDFTIYGSAPKKVKTVTNINIVDHVYEEIPELDSRVDEKSQQGGSYDEINLDASEYDGQPLHDVFIDRTPSMRPDFCCICKNKVRSLRRHANARHLPWFVDAMSACALCCTQTNHPTMVKHHNAEHSDLDTRLQPSLWRDYMMTLFLKMQQTLGLQDIQQLPEFVSSHNLRLSHLVDLSPSEQHYFKELGLVELFNPCRPVSLCDCSHWRIILRLIANVGPEQCSDLVRTIKPEEGRIFIRDMAVKRPKEPDYNPPLCTSHLAVDRSFASHESPSYLGISQNVTTYPHHYHFDRYSQPSASSSHPATASRQIKGVSSHAAFHRYHSSAAAFHTTSVPSKRPNASMKSLRRSEGIPQRSGLIAFGSGHTKSYMNDILALKPNFIHVGSGSQPETCIICNLDVPVLRMHANARHLPWFVDASTACSVCNTQALDHKSLAQHSKQHSGCSSPQLEPSYWFTLMMELFQLLKGPLGINNVDQIPRFVRQNCLGVLGSSNLSDKDTVYLDRETGDQNKPFNPQEPEILQDCCHWRIVLKLIAIAGEDCVLHWVRTMQPKYATLYVNPEQFAADTMFKEPLDHSLQVNDSISLLDENQTSFTSDSAHSTSDHGIPLHLMSDVNNDESVSLCLARSMEYPSDTEEYQGNTGLVRRQSIEDSLITRKSGDEHPEGSLLINTRRTHVNPGEWHSSISEMESDQGKETSIWQNGLRYLRRSHGFRSRSQMNNADHQNNQKHSTSSVYLSDNFLEDITEVNASDLDCIKAFEDSSKSNKYLRNRSPDPSKSRLAKIKSHRRRSHEVQTHRSVPDKSRDCARSHSLRLCRDYRSLKTKDLCFNVPYQRDYEYVQAIQEGRISPKHQRSSHSSKRSRSPIQRPIVLSDLTHGFLLDDSDCRSSQASSCTFSPQYVRDLDNQVKVLKRGMQSLSESIHNMTRTSILSP